VDIGDLIHMKIDFAASRGMKGNQ